jgi:hypothetical protein
MSQPRQVEIFQNSVGLAKAAAQAMLVVFLAAGLGALANVTVGCLSVIFLEYASGALDDIALWVGASQSAIVRLNTVLGWLPLLAPAILSLGLALYFLRSRKRAVAAGMILGLFACAAVLLLLIMADVSLP